MLFNSTTKSLAISMIATLVSAMSISAQVIEFQSTGGEGLDPKEETSPLLSKALSERALSSHLAGGEVGPWAAIPLSDPSWSMNGTTWADSFFWAVGSDRVLFSEDGAEWISVLDSPILDLFDIHSSNGLAVAVGTRYLLLLPFGDLVDLGLYTLTTGVTKASDRWVTVGGHFDGSNWQDRIYSSIDDGVSWTGYTTGSEDYLFDVEGTVISGSPSFVAVGLDGRLLTSSEGESWTSRNSGTPWNLLGVAFGNGIWVAVGQSGTILRSTNGNSWTDVSVSGGTLSEVHYAAGHFVAVGQGGRILSSTDGASWTTEDSETLGFLNSVAYGNGVWLAIGDNEVTHTTAPVHTPEVIFVNGPEVAYAIEICESNGTPQCTELVFAIPAEGEPRSYLLPGEDLFPINISPDIAFTEGSEAGEQINGHDGANSIHALGGNDLVYGLGGSDGSYIPTEPPSSSASSGLRGDSGNDIIYGNSGTDVLIGGIGDDLLFGGNDGDVIFGEDGADYLFGEDGDDSLFGNEGDDFIYGGNGDDFIDTGAGNNEAIGGTGSDTLLLAGFTWGLTVDLARGEAADSDRSVLFVEIENLIGTAYDDTFLGDDADNFLRGEGGDDTIYGAGGDDVIEGGEGNDTLKADDGNDVLYGGPGVDRLEGGAGDDFLQGGDGDDTLRGGDGNDTLYAETGNGPLSAEGENTLKGDAGLDHLHGGRQVDYLYGGLGDDILDGGDGDDRLRGEQGDDTLAGGDGNDNMMGHEGNDCLYGQRGDDAIYGGPGIDLLHGGEGADRLIGGGGADTFYFHARDIDGNADRLEDFDLSDGDQIDVTQVFNASGGDITHYVQLIPVGNKVEIHVDRDGPGTEHAAEHMATIFGAPGTTLDDLMSHDGLVLGGSVQNLCN